MIRYSNEYECCRNCPNNKQLFCNCTLPYFEDNKYQPITRTLAIYTSPSYNNEAKEKKMTENDNAMLEIVKSKDISAEAKIKAILAMGEKNEEDNENIDVILEEVKK